MKMVNLTFSVVTYNNEELIDKLITNIENTLPSDVSATIFVIDNVSTDHTVDVIKRLQQNYDNIQLIQSKQNSGFGAGHNLVLPFLTSEYHILINPDVQIQSSQELNKMINFMQLHSDVGLLAPKILNTDGSIQKSYRRSPTILDMAIRFVSPKLMPKRQSWFVHDETGYNQQGSIEQVSGAFMFFRTSVFKEIGGFDERYFMYMEDADITRKVNEVSEAIFYPDANVTHEWKRDSHSNIKFTFIMLNSMRKYFNKWGWRFK